jgi:hypothetical protein
MGERICEVDGCGNLGKLDSRGKREPLCDKHRRERWPALAEAQRAYRRGYDRRRRVDGRKAAQSARKLLRGEQIRDYSNHHAGIRHILGATKGDELTASRTCPDDCPDSWLGWHSGRQVPYRLCRWEHYVLELLDANEARKYL